MLVNRFDQTGQTLLEIGHFGESDIEFCHESLVARNQDALSVFDIGAGIGTFSSWVAHVFPRSHIYCFEPQRAVCELLTANAAINNFYNMHAYNTAVGDKDTTISYYEPDYFAPADFDTFSLTRPHELQCTENSVKIQQQTIDSFVTLHNVNSMDFLKITTNGMEVEVLRGANEALARFRPVIYMDYVPHGPNANRDDIVAILESHNYGVKGTDTNKILAVYEQL